MNPSLTPTRRNSGSVSHRGWGSTECYGMLHHSLLSGDRQEAGKGPLRLSGGWSVATRLCLPAALTQEGVRTSLLQADLIQPGCWYPQG